MYLGGHSYNWNHGQEITRTSKEVGLRREHTHCCHYKHVKEIWPIEEYVTMKEINKKANLLKEQETTRMWVGKHASIGGSTRHSNTNGGMWKSSKCHSFFKTMLILVSLNNFEKVERLIIMYIRIKDYHLCKLICCKVNKQKWYLEKACTNNGIYFPNFFFWYIWQMVIIS